MRGIHRGVLGPGQRNRAKPVVSKHYTVCSGVTEILGGVLSNDPEGEGGMREGEKWAQPGPRLE